MKASFFSLLAAAGIASAVTGLPTCANTCVASFSSSTSIDGCSVGDYKCVCSNTDFLNEIACCLQSKCDTADQATAVSYAGTLCKTFGVTVPTELTCKSTSSSSNSTTTTASNSTTTANATATSSSSSSSTSSTQTGGAALTAGSIGMVGLIGGLLVAML